MMAVTRVECLAGDRDDQSWWQWIGMSTERTGEISIVDEGEDITTGDGTIR